MPLCPDLIFADTAKQRKELEDKRVASKTRTRDSEFVSVGYFDSNGTNVPRRDPRHSYGALGLCLSRMKE